MCVYDGWTEYSLHPNALTYGSFEDRTVADALRRGIEN